MKEKSDTTAKNTVKRAHSFKTNPRFRLSFINENTFNEVWTVKMSQRKVVLALLMLLIAIGCMVATLIIFTPIRTLLPGYLKESQRQENIFNSMRIDSLSTEVSIHNAYVSNLERILNDRVDEASPAHYNDTISPAPTDSLIGATSAEKQFVRQFEEREKFNLNVLTPIAAEGVTFFTPVNGASIMSPKDGSPAEITLIVPRNAPVSSIYNGSVVDCYYTVGRGYTYIIQHPNGFMSKYSGLGSAFADKGQHVDTGSAIGLTGDNANSAQNLVTFELWNKGTRLNPQEYIPF